MRIMTGNFEFVEDHHKGWFKVFHFKHALEFWAGSRWLLIEWSN